MYSSLKTDYPKMPKGSAPVGNPFVGESLLDETLADWNTKDLFNYISDIPDPDVAGIVCSLAQEKLKQTFAVLDQFVKSTLSAIKAFPDFSLQFKGNFGPEGKLRTEYLTTLAKDANQELKILLDHIFKLGSYRQGKDAYEVGLNAELKLAAGLSIQHMSEQLKELVDYNQHVIRRRNFKKRAEPVPPVRTLTECYKQKDFDNIHKEKVNCVDICPFSKLMASGSSDGTIKFVDLDDLTYFPEMTIVEPQKKQIFSLCIDNQHNIAFVNESNLLKVVNLSTNHAFFSYQGQSLQELTDEVPDQAVQFTPDSRHLVFRSGAKEIVFFQTQNKMAQEKRLILENKIRDFSIAATCDFLATASYEALETEIYGCNTGHLVSKHKFEIPIFTVQWAPNGIHLLFGGGNGKIILVEFSKYHDKSLRVIHTFEGLFSVCSNIAALSISYDSQFAAVGARNGDYKVKVLNLWERRVQISLPENLHTYNVQAVRFSRNGKVLATCAEDTTVKALLLR